MFKVKVKDRNVQGTLTSINDCFCLFLNQLKRTLTQQQNNVSSIDFLIHFGRLFLPLEWELRWHEANL